jgi:outer membrane protein OmpA-like peptidoglycan-associated protein
MKPLHGIGLVAGLLSLMVFSQSALAQFMSREQIVRALITQPSTANFADKLRLTRSLTLDGPAPASVESRPTIDLHEIFFEFNSAAITREAEPQLRELGAALTDPRLKGSTISIGGHTDAVGSDGFNQALSERRAAAIKWYLVDNFGLQAGALHTVGYGKRQPKNRADVYAPENRRVAIVNETTRTQSQR